ncbi:MAG TPA: hypothetical protein VEX88_07390 [Glaciibacter sp.]|nr:hypothetical protein [Glaciibacter sp.]
MATDQYHEPPQELTPETRTFARMCANLTEEAEAIGWYAQRISVEPDPVARAIMTDSLGEEFKHFSMELEFLMRRNRIWRETAGGILFQDGDIVENGERAEAAAGAGGADAGGSVGGSVAGGSAGGSGSGTLTSPSSPGSSLGIGSLKGRQL